MILRGKHKPNFTPHTDGGDFVIVINARRVRLTGSKNQNKVYYRHSEYPGGIRTTTAEKLLAEKPEALVRLAIKGMLPKSRLGRRLVSKLKVYAGADHPHLAQKPQQLVLI
jgi:large subunit ribosomal protein L13